jgi:hypothetical protein
MKWVRLSTNLYIDLATLNRIEFFVTHGGNMEARLLPAGTDAEGDLPTTYIGGEAYELYLYLDALSSRQSEWLWWNLGGKPWRPRSGDARGQTPPGRADEAAPPKEQPKG